MAKRRRKKRSKKGIIFFLIIAAIIAAGLTAPFFNIRTVTVSGLSRLTEEEIINQAQIDMGNNIFRTSMGKAEKRLTKLPYVEKAEIARKFPDIVKIKITESVLAAYIKSEQGYIGIDKNGKVLEIANENENAVMTLTGVDTDGKILLGETLDGFSDTALECIEKLEECEILPIVADINLENSVNIIVTTREGLETFLGTTDELDYKIKLLQNIISQGYTSGIFDTSNPSQPTFRKNK